MITIKFRQNIKCEVFFYFGLKTYQDYKNVNEVFSTFCKRFLNCWPHPEFTKDETIFELIWLYEKNPNPKSFKKKLEKLKKIFKKNDQTKINVSDENLENYKTILEHFNILVRDELIDFIKRSRVDNLELVKIIENLNKFQITDKKKLLKESKVVIFCLTKSYLDSPLFASDWEEIKVLNKDFLLVLLETNLNYSYLNVEFHKVYDIYAEKYNPYGRRTFLSSQDAYRWGEDVAKMQKLGVEKHFKYLYDCLCRKMTRSNLKV